MTQPQSPDPAPSMPAPPVSIAGLGASAGGLEALRSFLSHLGPSPGLAFVVVQHLSPDYKSLMAEILSKSTSMTVVQARDLLEVEANHVYTIPPGHNLTLEGTRLRVREQTQHSGLKLPIDLFLASLAQQQGEHGIAIILSGTGSDGARGLRAVKEAGGLTLVQRPESARFSGMPISAIATGLADLVETPEQLAREVTHYAQRSASAHPSERPIPRGVKEPVRRRILQEVLKHTGIDFQGYKANTILRRIQRRMDLLHLNTPQAYLESLQTSPAEAGILARELLIGVTSFFRDPYVYENVHKLVIPSLLEAAQEDDELRAWVVGCATGEEAYSLAMLIDEAMSAAQISRPFKIFATDLNQEAISTASAGIYPESIRADISPARIDRYFTQRPHGLQVRHKLRERVVFAQHNVISDPPFTRMRFVSCRNLLIYLDSSVQTQVFGRLHFALRPGGFMVLGSSETPGSMQRFFKVIQPKAKIYQSLGHPRASLPHLLGQTALSMRPPPSASPQPTSAHGLAIERIYEILVETYAPAGFLVDEHASLLHVFGEANMYLNIPSGRVSMDLLKMLPRHVTAILSVALRRATAEDEHVLYRGVRLTKQGREELVDLRVRPVHLIAGLRHALVLLESQAGSAKTPEVDVEFDGASQRRNEELERELMFTRESLQATIEELETTNEELQATNEELLASNEELQSANEELQSTNEELYTVNAEYDNKIRELIETNADMNNLLSSTEIGTVFLDESLAIRRFTPSVTQVIHLIDQDIGRPLAHISHKLLNDNLLEACQQVLEQSSLVERYVETSSQRIMLMRLTPYQSDFHEQNGVVLTFIDVTHQRRALAELQALIDTMAHPVALIDAQGRITSTNTQWQTHAPEHMPLPHNQEHSLIEHLQPLAAQGSEPAQSLYRGLQQVLSAEIPVTLKLQPASNHQLNAQPLPAPFHGAILTLLQES